MEAMLSSAKRNRLSCRAPVGDTSQLQLRPVPCQLAVSTTVIKL
jgi:hypothetical protein